MDKHLNLFNSYSEGKFDRNILTENILEDNLTRAFIITLKEIPELAINLLEKLVFKNENIINKNDKLQYDLQILDKKVSVGNYLNKKYLLGISPSGNKPTSNYYFESIYQDLEQKKFSISEKINSKENFIKHISKLYYNEDPDLNFLKDLKSYNKDEDNDDLLQYIYDITKGCRPDAWIFQKNNFIILIENKINGELYTEQISRHKSDKENGLDKFDNEVIKEVTLSWIDIFNTISEFKCENEKEKYIKKEFLEYLDLSGFGPFKLIVEQDYYFKKRLRRKLKNIINTVIKDIKKEFIIKNRTISKDYYGLEIYNPEYLKSKNTFADIIHISIGINTSNKFTVYLVLEKVCKMKKLLATLKITKQLNTFINAINNLKTIDYIKPKIIINERWFVKRRDMKYWHKNIYKVEERDNIRHIKNIISDLENIFSFNKQIKILKNTINEKEIEEIKILYSTDFKTFIDHFFYKSKKAKARTVTPTINICYEFDFNFINNHDNLYSLFFNCINNLMPVYSWFCQNIEEE